VHAPSWPTKDESSALLDRSAEAPLLTLPTPALVIERPALLANIDEMTVRARRAGAALWPHGKTHKCAEIAGLQRSHGAAGLTVATLNEAEYFAAAGFVTLRWLARRRPQPSGPEPVAHAIATVDRTTWRMPSLTLLQPVTWSTGTRLGMLALRGYLIIGAVLLIVKAIQLGRG